MLHVPPPSDLLEKIEHRHACGPLEASSDHLQKLADLYEQWLAVYRYASDRLDDAREAGEAKTVKEADVVVGQSLRRMKELICEICDCPAQTIVDLGRKARILREHSKDWWAERQEPLARSLCLDALRLAEMAAPQIPDFSPQEMIEHIMPTRADRVRA